MLRGGRGKGRVDVGLGIWFGRVVEGVLLRGED